LAVEPDVSLVLVVKAGMVPANADSKPAALETWLKASISLYRGTAVCKRWCPETALFWKVKHGIRFTAMPSFATTLQEEEIWKIAMFLKLG
jgi:Cytochrome C oxidase, cbb3-type, subunit III